MFRARTSRSDVAGVTDKTIAKVRDLLRISGEDFPAPSYLIRSIYTARHKVLEFFFSLIQFGGETCQSDRDAFCLPPS
jgi:hypothetical protein